MNIIETAQHWANQDPDNETRQELQTLIDNENIEELTKLFADRLQFGTAGLRGRLQAGTMGMNRVLVAQTAKGLANFLLSREDTPSIVIGYDARKNSKIFAQDTAEIMQGAGITAHIMPDLRPTPVLAFAVRHLNASAGVMVTASHNPPADNGYKVYLGGDDGGAQIVSPNDKSIADHIQQVADNQKVNDFARDDNYQTIEQSVIDEFISQTASLATAPVDNDLKYVYTAMHGVGTQTLQQVLDKANLPQPILVDKQCDPDGSFPTVDFPNPEEKGALDLAIATAKEHNAEFIIANDPDADRLAVAVADDNGQWASLHGNEIGLYLAWHIAQEAQKQGETGTLACSLVSSPLLAKVAQAYDLQHTETLTGFKYISRVPNLIFGYEEALGYLVDPNKVHDKDGVSATVSFLDLVNTLKAQGQSFADYRQAFTAKFGAFASDQLSVRVADLSRIERILSHIRQSPFTTIADLKVERYLDYATLDNPANILTFSLEGDNRIIVRPSGTEPKLKVYIDTQGAGLAQAREISQQLKTAVQVVIDGIE